MNTGLRAWLDGKPLDSIDGIWIIGIDEAVPASKTVTESISGGGTRFISGERTGLTVDVRFQIELEGQADRLTAMDLVKSWCRDGGRLEISTRPGKFLQVRCQTLPGMTSLKGGTAFKASFMAYEMPYWQDAAPAVSVTNAPMYVPGTEKHTTLDARIRNAGSAVCNTLSIETEKTRFAFAGLGLQPGETLCISHDQRGFVRIMIETAGGETRSAYDKRTPESDDDLLLTCGAMNTITISAQTKTEHRIEARGRWL